jgi:hypothetical protein
MGMGRSQLINTAARFLLRPLSAFVFHPVFPICCYSTFTLNFSLLAPPPLSTSFSFFSLSPPHHPPMSYLAHPPRAYHSPDPSTYSHSQLPVQNVRNIANMAPFDSLSAQHSAQSPDHRLPKVGETRCCQLYPYYFTFLHDRSFIVYISPRLFCSFERLVDFSADPFPFSLNTQIGLCSQQTSTSCISTPSFPTTSPIKRTF